MQKLFRAFMVLPWVCSFFSATANCFEEAAVRYHVSPLLLRAIAEQESNGNPRAVNVNRNGSRDIGLMQINTFWLPVLKRYGVDQEKLWEPCTNVMVGAWILANNFSKMGYTYQALGAYNATHPSKREKYAKEVLYRLAKMTGSKNNEEF